MIGVNELDLRNDESDGDHEKRSDELHDSVFLRGDWASSSQLLTCVAQVCSMVECCEAVIVGGVQISERGCG